MPVRESRKTMLKRLRTGSATTPKLCQGRRAAIIAVSAILVLTSPGCSTIQHHKGATIGSAIGAAGGYALCRAFHGNSGQCIASAVAGGVGGYMLGNLYDQRQRELAKAAKKTNTPVAFEKVEVPTNTNKQKAVPGVLMAVNEPTMFKIGSAVPTPRARRSFNSMARVYAQKLKTPKGRIVDTKLLIVGHTDSTGSAQLNQRLSEKRAMAIARIFTHKGMPANRLYVQGAGSSQPVADNSTAAGRARNRRVEILEIQDEKDLVTFAEMRQRDERFLRHSTRQPSKTRVAKESVKPVAHAKPATKSAKSQGSKQSSTSDVHPVRSGRPALINFDGTPAHSKGSTVIAAIGKPVSNSQTWFEAIGIESAQAADVPPPVPCYADAPRRTGSVVSYATGQSVDTRNSYVTADFIRGMDRRAWASTINGNLVGIGPVSVLRDGARPVSDPTLYVFQHYHVGDEKATTKKQTHVETYEGQKGVLYRVYLKDDDAPVDCIDLALPRSGRMQALRGELYYYDRSTLMQVRYLPAVGG